jgi:hypothetical protein
MKKVCGGGITGNTGGNNQYQQHGNNNYLQPHSQQQ